MCSVISVQLEWRYSPKTYLEQPISIDFEGGRIEIKEGVALAIIDPDSYHANPSIREELTNKITSRLQAVQIMMHKGFELNSSSCTYILEDGKQNSSSEANPFDNASSSDRVDVVVKDKKGNILSDTKRERLDKQKHLGLLIEKHRATDFTLNKMLNSYQQAVNDPGDELVHLYEIKDALSEKFGSEKKAIPALDITKSEWDQLKKLANDPSLNQGRHRGKAVGTKRNANPAELETARKLACHLIDKYLHFLESVTSK